MQKKNNILFFDSFLQFPELIHGFSTRSVGDMRPSHKGNEMAREVLAKTLQINPPQVVSMNQVHGSHVEVVDLLGGGKIIQKTDGLVTQEKNIFLTVMVGDCVPILLYDRSKKIGGAVHAGWRGLLNEIISEAIAKMKSLGANPIDIIGGIGPCIRSCHYNIDEKRVELFTNRFGKKHGETLGYINEDEGKTYLDMPCLAALQLAEEGLLMENIEDARLCTFESTDLYSYRREGEGFGEFLGIIGRK
jgi:YfiH family protein